MCERERERRYWNLDFVSPKNSPEIFVSGWERKNEGKRDIYSWRPLTKIPLENVPNDKNKLIRTPRRPRCSSHVSSVIFSVFVQILCIFLKKI